MKVAASVPFTGDTGMYQFEILCMDYNNILSLAK